MQPPVTAPPEDPDRLEAALRRAEALERELRQHQNQQSEVRRQLQQARDLERTLAKREKEVGDRETEAAEGFARQHRRTLAELDRESAKKRAELVDLDAKQQSRLAAQERDLADHAARMRLALEQELLERRRGAESDLAASREALAADRRALERSQAAHFAEAVAQRAEASTEFAASVAAAREQFAEARAAMEARLRRIETESELTLAASVQQTGRREQEDRDRRARLQAELAAEQDKTALLSVQRDALAREVESARRTRLALGDRPAEEVLDELEQLRSRVEEQRQELGRRATREQTEELDSLRQQNGLLVQTISELQRQNGELKGKLTSQTVAKNEVDLLERERESMTSRFAALDRIYTARLKELQAELDRLLERTAEKTAETTRLDPNSAEAGRRRGDLDIPLLDRFETELQPASEQAWLDEIGAGMLAMGMIYPPRLLKSFHTCLKIAELSPLTVLSGVSGTGKSELPRLYALLGGINFDALSVQPNWNSPVDVFGYFNPLDNRFAAQPLLRHMVQSHFAAEYGGLDDQLTLILLDEMNLAQVETYLSELLSKWERRRGTKEGEVALQFDLGPDCDKYAVPLGRNLLIVGTINEDETTQTLSAKVLDRGNLLYFPRPPELARRRSYTLPTNEARLPRRTWESWCVFPDQSPELREACEPYRKLTGEMNVALDGVARPLGHRLWQAIEMYLINHPDVRDKLLDRAVAMRHAFEDQFVQRIVPKLRGLEFDDPAENACIDRIEKLIEEAGLGLLDDFAAARSDSRGVFTWRRSDYLTSTRSLHGTG